MTKLINGLLDRIFVVLGVIVLSQAPQFFSQYEDHLEGHLAELQLQITQIQMAAQYSGKSIEEYIAKFQSSKDTDFVMQGKLMTDMRSREKKLSKSILSLQNASVLSRPFYFIYNVNWNITKETFRSFQIGFVLNKESLLYSLLGLFLGLGLYALFKSFVTNFCRLFQRRSS